MVCYDCAGRRADLNEGCDFEHIVGRAGGFVFDKVEVEVNDAGVNLAVEGVDTRDGGKGAGVPGEVFEKLFVGEEDCGIVLVGGFAIFDAEYTLEEVSLS